MNVHSTLPDGVERPMRRDTFCVTRYIYHVEKKKATKVGSNIYFSTKERCYTTTTDEKFLPPPAAHENYQPGYKKGNGADTRKVHFVFGDEPVKYETSSMPDPSAFCKYQKAHNRSQKVHVHFGDDPVNYTSATAHHFAPLPADMKPNRIHKKSKSGATNIVFGDDKLETKTQNQEVRKTRRGPQYIDGNNNISILAIRKKRKSKRVSKCPFLFS